MLGGDWFLDFDFDRCAVNFDFYGFLRIDRGGEKYRPGYKLSNGFFHLSRIPVLSGDALQEPGMEWLECNIFLARVRVITA